VTESVLTAAAIGPAAPAPDDRLIRTIIGMITAGTKCLSYAHIPVII
jgi:hypothetical protein